MGDTIQTNRSDARKLIRDNKYIYSTRYREELTTGITVPWLNGDMDQIIGVCATDKATSFDVIMYREYEHKYGLRCRLQPWEFKPIIIDFKSVQISNIQGGLAYVCRELKKYSDW